MSVLRHHILDRLHLFAIVSNGKSDYQQSSAEHREQTGKGPEPDALADIEHSDHWKHDGDDAKTEQHKPSPKTPPHHIDYAHYKHNKPGRDGQKLCDYYEWC